MRGRHSRVVTLGAFGDSVCNLNDAGPARHAVGISGIVTDERHDAPNAGYSFGPRCKPIGQHH